MIVYGTTNDLPPHLDPLPPHDGERRVPPPAPLAEEPSPRDATVVCGKGSG